MSHMSPLLFDVTDGDGVLTLPVRQGVYRQAREVMDAGHRLAIRGLRKKCYELSVWREHEPLAAQPITLTTTYDNSGIALHEAAERLVAQAHRLLFSPLPW